MFLKPFTNYQLQQRILMQKFQNYVVTNVIPIKIKKGGAHWYYTNISGSDCYVAITFLIAKNQIKIELIIPDSKELYLAYRSNFSKITNELGLDIDVVGLELPKKKRSKICTIREFNLKNPNLKEAFNWIAQTTKKFESVFSKFWPLIENQ